MTEKTGYRLTEEALNRLKKSIRAKHGDIPYYRLASVLGLSKDSIRRVLQEDANVSTVKRDTIESLANAIGLLLTEADYVHTAKGNTIKPNFAEVVNPFFWRECLTEPAAFWGRNRELNRLKTFLRLRLNSHIVGSSKVGKSSLVRQLHHLLQTDPTLQGTETAFVDMNDYRTHTSIGMLKAISEGFAWNPMPNKLIEFNELVVKNIISEKRYFVCLDNFDRYSSRPEDKFETEFWENMRWLSENKGVSIFTVSSKLIEEIHSSSGNTSPFYNISANVVLPNFTLQEAEGFVGLPREGIPPFTTKETAEILKRSRCHPLALQILCDHVLETKISDESGSLENSLSDVELEGSLSNAEAEVRRRIEGWANESSD